MKKEKPPLHVVIATGIFKDPQELSTHAANLMKQFPPNEPHVFLYPELPFKGIYLRKDTKKALKETLIPALNKTHPLSAVAFSTPELGITGHSNTGYFVTAKGYKHYPKLEKAGTDQITLDKLGKILKKDINWYWNKRTEKWKNKRKNETTPFPTHEFANGQKTEYRVCKDAINPNNTPNTIVLISAMRLGTPAAFELAKKARTVIINDYETKKHLGPRVLTPNNHGLRIFKLTPQNAENTTQQYLKKHGIAIHFPKN